jgi:NAD(P)-dependent dehydrogenase (short-subunit alcohol dehydrogenase family)
MDERVVIVTGGANGIGWATSQRFAAAGDRVIVVDRDGSAATNRANALKNGGSAEACDISCEEDVDRMIAACMTRYGRIDVLINNAGVIDGSGSPLVDQNLESVRSLLSVNVRGTYQTTQKVAAEMLKSAGGVIVNIASCAGFVATPYRSGYGASKAAIISMTRTLAYEWAPLGVRVVGLAPGYIRTDMVDQLIQSGKLDPHLVERCIPIGRMGRPEEMAEAIFHLASKEASYVCGATLVADGGFMAFGGSGDASLRVAPTFDRKGPRSVVIAGAAEEIGRSVADVLSGRGDRVMLFDGDERKLGRAAEQLSGAHLTFAGEAIDEEVVSSLSRQVFDAWGGVDVVVNCSAGFDHCATAVEHQPTAFDNRIDQNLMTAFALARVLGPSLLERGGCFVNVVPRPVWESRTPSHGLCAANAGLEMLTRSLACEWGPRGVRVNAVAPSFIETPIAVGKGAGDADQRIERLGDCSPMGRPGTSKEVADVVAFLCSDNASYINGSVLEVDGGWQALCETNSSYANRLPQSNFGKLK